MTNDDSNKKDDRSIGWGEVIGGALAVGGALFAIWKGLKSANSPESVQLQESPQPSPGGFEVNQYIWYKHPDCDYEIMLDKWRLGVHGPNHDYFDVRSLPQGVTGGKWVALLGQNNQQLPLKVCWNGGRLFAEWLPSQQATVMQQQIYQRRQEEDPESVEARMDQAIRDSNLQNKIFIDTIRNMAGFPSKPPGFF
jgi:hypothetical protein